jgi:hypothetical protein
MQGTLRDQTTARSGGGLDAGSWPKAASSVQRRSYAFPGGRKTGRREALVPKLARREQSRLQAGLERLIEIEQHTRDEAQVDLADQGALGRGPVAEADEAEGGFSAVEACPPGGPRCRHPSPGHWAAGRRMAGWKHGRPTTTRRANWCSMRKQNIQGELV